MKQFRLYRRLIKWLGVFLAVLPAAGIFIHTGDVPKALPPFLYGAGFAALLFLIDFLYSRYIDDLLEQVTLLIEELVGKRELFVFPQAEDTLLSRMQDQLLKLRGILISQNRQLAGEKDQIKALISDISHQIKTPLAAAKTFTELLEDDGLSKAEREEYLEILQSLLDKLTFLTNRMVQMSRLESGMIQLKPRKVLLNDVVLHAVKSVCHKAQSKGIVLSFPCEQRYEVTLDYHWTAEAITNVLDNAVKYTPEQGRVELSIEEYPSYLRLDIRDNGPGIPEDERPKIFQRFYRGCHSAGVDGVGIGLYLTRDILNKQDGYIKVAAEENGSTFSIFLRREDSQGT